MSACENDCDCGRIGLRKHEPYCSIYSPTCEDGKYCDKHFREAMRENAYLKHVSKYTVMPIDEEYEQEMRDAGRLYGR